MAASKNEQRYPHALRLLGCTKMIEVSFFIGGKSKILLNKRTISSDILSKSFKNGTNIPIASTADQKSKHNVCFAPNYGSSCTKKKVNCVLLKRSNFLVYRFLLRNYY